MGTLQEHPFTFLIISRSFILRMKNVSDKSCGENQNTRFMFSNIFFPKNVPLEGNVEKHCRAGLARDDQMEHAHCMLDN